MQCEYYALEGLSQLMTTVRMVKKSMNPSLALEGVLLTMFDGRTNLSIQVVEEVKKHFPGEVFSSVVPRNVRLSEAPSHGKPITNNDRMCRGAEAYLSLADEILKKNKRERGESDVIDQKGTGRRPVQSVRRRCHRPERRRRGGGRRHPTLPLQNRAQSQSAAQGLRPKRVGAGGEHPPARRNHADHRARRGEERLLPDHSR